jgi:hypothetical protein
MNKRSDCLAYPFRQEVVINMGEPRYSAHRDNFLSSSPKLFDVERVDGQAYIHHTSKDCDPVAARRIRSFGEPNRARIQKGAGSKDSLDCRAESLLRV